MRITLATLSLLFACAFASDVIIDLTQASNENTIYTAFPGDKVIMKLNENPTTGYSWSLLNMFNNNE